MPKASLLDTGASANLISTHDVDVSKLKLVTSGLVFTMWNGSTQKVLGRADIEVYNPKQNKSYSVTSDVVPGKLTPILGNSVVQVMQLITVTQSSLTM